MHGLAACTPEITLQSKLHLDYVLFPRGFIEVSEEQPISFCLFIKKNKKSQPRYIELCSVSAPGYQALLKSAVICPFFLIL